ncbi:hypothetical protein DTL42_20675 [Bremerella cremea]|uniref:Tetratricopeptide repeat protein n=1 Tax=Bremerella cremea TaxID=1031537 RepID=A0A368KM18_9BACT|nr:hypothetical protein [Bremerella cremea]RCS42237.1 hypothetical protein DTL42_20675 [Bremerella cremea]
MSCTHRLAIPILLAVTFLAGCSDTPRKHRTIADTQADLATDPGSAKQFVDTAFTFIKDLDLYTRQAPGGAVQEKVFEDLNRWFIAQPKDPQWQPDPLIAELPESIQAMPRLQDLASRPFLPAPRAQAEITYRGSEYDYILSSYWEKAISNGIKQRWDDGQLTLPPQLARFMKAQENHTLTESEAEQLSLAYLLFDWTVRNIQPVREEEIVRETFEPGTSRDVWRVLQVMQGDALERARVFIHLCRQQDLDAVVVQFGEKDPVTQVVGVHVGKHLYLFDTAYGLPIATSDGTGIQTLTQLVEHPEDLQAMASKNYKYPVTPEKLKHVTLLVEAPSTSLTQATDMLEQTLTGEEKLNLHVRPSLIKDRLKEMPGVTDVKLWEAPFESEQSIAKWLSQPELAAEFRNERRLYDFPGGISLARTLQLMNRFNDEPQRPGARSILLETRLMSHDLRNASITEKTEMLKAMGIDFGQDTQARDAYLAHMQQNANLWREMASFNLGVIALDEREYRSSLDFFEKRTLEPYPESKYKSAVFYGIGRSYEALSKEEDADASLADKAIQFYTNDDDVLSPYRRGNALRAQRLAPPEDQPEATSESETPQPQPNAAENNPPETTEPSQEATETSADSADNSPS